MNLSCSVAVKALALAQKKRGRRGATAQSLITASGLRRENCLVFPSSNLQTLGGGGADIILIPNKNEVEVQDYVADKLQKF